jgi:hypothetical protein
MSVFVNVPFGAPPKTAEERLKEAQAHVRSFQSKAADFEATRDELKRQAAAGERDGVPSDPELVTRLRLAGADAGKARRDAASWQKKVDEIKDKIKDKVKPQAVHNNPIIPPLPIPSAPRFQPGQYFSHMEKDTNIYKIVKVNLKLPGESDNTLYFTYVPMETRMQKIPWGERVKLAPKVRGKYAEKPVKGPLYAPMSTSVKLYNAEANLGESFVDIPYWAYDD